ncbi:MAG TPA: histidine triad nucleotide-binding protein [Clostridiales bacterium]|nr:histidine triad nucleotide-binding protein [Clostridiales bacterium]
MSDCIFCKIAGHEIPAAVVYEDDDVIAFDDLHPLAKVHILLIPKKHIASAAELAEEDAAVVGKIYLVAKKIAEEKGLAKSGYRIVNNCKSDGGQEVFHIHFHLLGGEKLGLFV